jgi:hypothetical protein
VHIVRAIHFPLHESNETFGHYFPLLRTGCTAQKDDRHPGADPRFQLVVAFAAIYLCGD